MTKVSMRPAAQEDEQFLYSVSCVNMRDVVEQTWGWDDVWQLAEFDRRFRQCSVSVIEVESRAVGGLFLEERSDSLCVHELQIAPAFQGRGIGTAVVKTVIEQGASRGLLVALSVVSATPRAVSLYERLGFRVTQVEPPFVRMPHDTRSAV